MLYHQGVGARRATGTHGKGGHTATMQGDGNFVLYTAAYKALWSSGTWGHDGAYLAVQDDGQPRRLPGEQGALGLAHQQEVAHGSQVLNRTCTRVEHEVEALCLVLGDPRHALALDEGARVGEGPDRLLPEPEEPQERKPGGERS